MKRLSALLGLLIVAAAPAAHASEVIARAPIGPIAGQTVPGLAAPVAEFRAIPFALAPIGERRWKPAQLWTQPWKETRRTEAFAPACMQPQKFGSVAITRNMAEDCLYLNIWTPANLSARQIAKLPVMVWIHGGSLLTGRAASDGAKLASKGVVVVSIAYRLGVFGYFSHPELSAESPHRASGNYGTTDQIAALQWVKANIAGFGGDPGKITIFGQSAGAFSVMHLLASPLAKGLFHRAIAQSAYMRFLRPLKRDSYGLVSAEEAGVRFGRAAGAGSLRDLRALPPQALLDVINGYDDRYHILPDVALDGWVHRAQLFQAFERGSYNRVPLIIGSTSNESHNLLTEREDWRRVVPADAAAYRTRTARQFGPQADAYRALYPTGDFAAIDEPRWVAPMRDASFGFPTQKFARDIARTNPHVYLYYFDQRSPWQGRAGAFHGADIRYAFDRWNGVTATADDHRMTQIMQDYWVSFAKSGSPNLPARPHWQRYTARAQAYMALRDGTAVPAARLLPGMLEFWEAQFRARWAAGRQAWTTTSFGAYTPELYPDPGTN